MVTSCFVGLPHVTCNFVNRIFKKIETIIFCHLYAGCKPQKREKTEKGRKFVLHHMVAQVAAERISKYMWENSWSAHSSKQFFGLCHSDTGVLLPGAVALISEIVLNINPCIPTTGAGSCQCVVGGLQGLLFWQVGVSMEDPTVVCSELMPRWHWHCGKF